MFFFNSKPELPVVDMNMPLIDWELLPVDIYKATIEQLEKRFDEHSLEIGTITERSIKLLTLFITFLGIAGIAILKDHHFDKILFIFTALSIFDIFQLFTIIKGRDSMYKGLNVDDILNVDFDRTDLNNEEKTRLCYNNIVVKLNAKIIKLQTINEARIKEFNVAFLLSVSLFLVVSFYYGYFLYQS